MGDRDQASQAEDLARVLAAQGKHEAAHAAISTSSDELVLSPLVLAEIDSMINANQGVDAEIAFLEEVQNRHLHAGRME